MVSIYCAKLEKTYSDLFPCSGIDQLQPTNLVHNDHAHTCHRTNIHPHSYCAIDYHKHTTIRHLASIAFCNHDTTQLAFPHRCLFLDITRYNHPHGHCDACPDDTR